MPRWNRTTIHHRIRKILADVRGVDEVECELTATLFGDLGLESIDLMEISARFDRIWGFPIPLAALTGARTALLNNQSSSHKEHRLRALFEKLRLDVDKGAFISEEPQVSKAHWQGVLGLFTVETLVEFVWWSLRTSSESR